LWIVFGGSAAVLLVSAALVTLATLTLSGRMWAYKVMVVLTVLGLAFAAVLSFNGALYWSAPIGPAIFFLLLVFPISQYRQYAKTR
jgi:hypothetical protein